MNKSLALKKTIWAATVLCLLAALSCSAYASKGGGGGSKNNGGGAVESSSVSDSLIGTVGGEAYGLSLEVNGLRGLLSSLSGLSVDLGPFPYVSLAPYGGFDAETLLRLNLLDLVQSKTLSTITAGGVGTAKAGAMSVSSIEHLNLLGGLIRADLLQSICSSYANGEQANSDATTTLGNLWISGKKISLSAPPNTRVDLVSGLTKLGTVVINEQKQTGDGVNSSGITSNVLRVSLRKSLLSLLDGEIIVSSAQCGVHARKVGAEEPPVDPDPEASGFVTGGGRIGSGSDFATFGFNARPGKGQLQYNDHATGMKVHGSTITDFEIQGNCAIFSGSARVDNQDGVDFTVEACDYGEPGINNDTFSIELDTGYSKSGVLTGGNIQLH
ncbi:choice-of-anchor P family protein [Nitrosomonas sp. ANs5]|uniref:choice-of-anchor P family protein n=1 Tax=Nitrosomonas sp. ANs5 TaxID=3423941 RepID=UPI003D334C68